MAEANKAKTEALEQTPLEAPEKKLEITPEIRAMVDAMVEAALAKKADEILSKASGGNLAEEKKRKKRQAEIERLEEKVEIRLFKDDRDYKDDVFVAINGVGYQIQRGIPVKVPRKVAILIEQSMQQDEKTARLIERETEAYRAAEKEITGN